MADLEEVFKITANSGTGAGIAPIARVEGEAAAAQSGLIGFSFKDSSGNVVLPQLTASGALPVDTSGVAGTCLKAVGENAGSLSEVTLATITGQLSKSYAQVELIASCLRSTRFRVVYVDDAGGTPAETELYSGIAGPGQFTICCVLRCGVTDTSGGTGTQEFRALGQNLFRASTMDAAIALLES